MRIRTRDARVNQSGPTTLANVMDGFLADGVAFERIRAVAIGEVQAGKTLQQAGDAAARGLHFDGDGNRVAVIFDKIKDRKSFGAGHVQGFPEFTFAGGAVSGRDINNFLGLVIDKLAEWRFFGLREGFRVMLVIQSGFGGADCLDVLRAGAGRLADDIEFCVAPMGRHLATARTWIVFRADGLKKSLQWRYTQHQAQRSIAIIGVDPVHAGAQKKTGGGGNRFVASAGYLEIDLVLPLELNLPVIQAPREEHRAVKMDEGFAIEALILWGFQLGYFDASLYCHSVCPRVGLGEFLPRILIIPNLHAS